MLSSKLLVCEILSLHVYFPETERERERMHLFMFNLIEYLMNKKKERVKVVTSRGKYIYLRRVPFTMTRD